MTPDMQRVDGKQKSETGFLGPIPNTATGKTMTEVSMGIEIDGEEVLIPLLVPSLTEEEIKIMQNMEIEGNIENVPQSIKDKAIEHAIQRMKENKNPFYNNDKAEGGSIDNITATEEQVQNIFGLEPNKKMVVENGLLHKFYMMLQELL